MLQPTAAGGSRGHRVMRTPPQPTGTIAGGDRAQRVMRTPPQPTGTIAGGDRAQCVMGTPPQPRQHSRGSDDTSTSTRPAGRAGQKKKEKALEKTRAYYSAPCQSLNDMQMRDLASAYSSAPWHKPDLSKHGLKDFQTLTECLQLISELAEEVNDISELKRCRKRGLPAEGASEPDSLESSRSVVLKWAEELDTITMLKKASQTSDDRMMGTKDHGGRRERSLDKDNERLQQWALELRNVKEANGLSDEDLKRLLCPRGQKESRLSSILPLLEFVAWSLLSHNTEEVVSKAWLPAKQKAWRTGKGRPKYIPNSVWQWILSASVSVRLDPSTSHPWLLVSADRLQVREAPQLHTTSYDLGPDPPPSRRFDGWPCVLGDAAIATGRHYWQVRISPPGGTWRIGVTAASAPRKKRFPMSPKAGFWTLWMTPQQLWACTDPPTKLPGALQDPPPHLIGVYVDVEEGQVSFYDVANRCHIYTFSDTFRQSLVPVFACMDGDTALAVVPANTNV